jgi:hypothetical protein
VCRSKNQKTHVANWIKSLLRDGVFPKLTIVEGPLSSESWAERERFWIVKLKDSGADLTNCLPGCEGGATYGRLGKKWTPEHRANYLKTRIGFSIKQKDPHGKRRAAIVRSWESGLNRGMTGRHHTPKTKAKMRASALRRKK